MPLRSWNSSSLRYSSVILESMPDSYLLFLASSLADFCEAPYGGFPMIRVIGVSCSFRILSCRRKLLAGQVCLIECCQPAYLSMQKWPDITERLIRLIIRHAPDAFNVLVHARRGLIGNSPSFLLKHYLCSFQPRPVWHERVFHEWIEDVKALPHACQTHLQTSTVDQG